MRRTCTLLAVSLSAIPILWWSLEPKPMQAAQMERGHPETAWELLLRQNPSLADDESISPFRRIILNVLTPAQAEDLYNGADPAEILLYNGLSLQEYQQRMMSSQRGD